MRFLVDQNLHASLATRLTAEGHPAEHTASIGLARAEDPEVFEWCRENNSVLLTADKKLTKFLAETRAASPTVVVYRDYDLDAARLEGDLLANLGVIEATVAGQGDAVFSLGPNRPIRVELLPFGLS